MNTPTGLLIHGFGGHARSVADIALACGVAQLLFIDANARPGESFHGFEVRSEWGGPLPPGWAVFSASGNGATRRRQIAAFRQAGLPIATLVAPDATLGFGSRIGVGTLVARSAHVGPDAVVGEGCIINTGAIVEHECTIGDWTHVSVNATIAGRSRIGAACMIGAGATVIDGVGVCDRVVVGAGAVVVRLIDVAGVYAGVPARVLRGASP
ncbi:MAG: NeuD/PglB/VioB family sugar acetyltransferase [Proteobacteria bacterium]|uniref:NeuD/PglB/VioB family sugar acetyltransferase n=1 Tax=Rudaea sp. TaxID=2136325 RepID=UPI001E0483BB|nr:NeuD/PglB/VioB family sugar acetyltransferase [Pseudomonadota bacterium]MBS0567902.1 NeuD/PglB/VioB family sugar acetyltransferase [Pseudomonadota bacterium]